MVKFNKKGNLGGIAIMMIILTVLAVVIVMCAYFQNTFYTQFNKQVTSTPEMVASEAKMKSAFSSFDYAMITLTIVLTGCLLISSFFIPTHPIFMGINIFGIFGLVFLGMLLNNIFGEIMTGGSSILLSTAEGYPKIIYLMKYLPYIGAIAVFLMTVIMYGIYRNQGGAGNY